ncbi:cytochrome P450 [Mycena alexandri]|uniref:Cytochrome P450 n=1 Tax=Mycena alexandri TaxID=1745969 RepID=A0AAD6SMZ5_9AGAR|nr:cytochrome P450 [Mycena alexandri]
MALLRFAASIASTLGAYALYTLLKVLYQEFTSPLRNVPGPQTDHWLLGNRKKLLNFDGQEGLWTQEYGRTVRINRLFGFSQLYTTDSKALQHILSNDYVYQKPAAGRYFLGRVVGPGVLIVEEDAHKKQRKIMNPAFGPAQLRALTEIFVEKSRQVNHFLSGAPHHLKWGCVQLRDLWAAKAAESGGVARLNVIPEFSTAALDIIGKAGFNYDFRALGAGSENVRDELHDAFATVSGAGDISAGLMDIIKARIPLLRGALPNTKIDKVINGAQATMRRIGLRLLQDSRQKIVDGSSADSVASRDLLSLLVRANMAKDITEAQQLSEEDVLAQVPTFLVAGHETNSTAATWALFEIAKSAEIQTRLRNELLAVDTENPTMDELNALPYLDCVVRETQRAHAPVPISFRVAMRDDIIPLENPYTDRNGTTYEGTGGRTAHFERKPRSGDLGSRCRPIHARYLHYQLNLALTSRSPERWERSPAISTSIPGLWSSMLTFLGGPRACIGFRFSLVELKALLFTLVRSLEFELAVPAADIGRLTMTIVQQPMVRSDPAAGSQMPILVKPFTPL